MKRLTVLFVLLALAASSIGAEVEFHNLDLGKDDSLLFSAKADLPGGGSFETLFAADLAKGNIVQLSIYPEHVALVEGGKRLLVQNRFGLFRSDTATTNLAPVPGYPSFARGSPVRQGMLDPCSPSPDGAWVLSAIPSSAAYARLVLIDTAKGTETVIASKVEFSVEDPPARWSPDSRHFVYSKGGSLYYFSIDQQAGSRVIEEEFRRIGEGRIGCARWSSDGSLFYMRGTSLFRILTAEFFTQALYRGMAGMGALAGKLPFPFDPSFDDFWVSSEGSRILFAKGGRNLFLIYLDPDDFGSESRVMALPYLFFQGDTMVKSVLWPSGAPLTVITGSLRNGDREAGAYRMEAPADPALLDLAPTVTELDVRGAIEVILSPDASKVAIVAKDGVTVRSYSDWNLRGEIKAIGAMHALWLSEDRLVVAGTSLIETVSLSTGIRGVVGLSQVEKYGRAEDGSWLAMTTGVPYRRSTLPLGSSALSISSAPAPGAPAAAPAAGTTAPGGAAAATTVAPAAAPAAGATAPAAGAAAPVGAAAPAAGATAPAAPQTGKQSFAALAVVSWMPSTTYSPVSPSTSSEAYRVYLDALAAGAYRNTVMVRGIKVLGTRPLFPPPATSYAAFPLREEPRADNIFDHGSRIRRREISLVFNALDSAEGLARVVSVLKDYGVTATFFINGEFVNRNPGAARFLSGSGHEMGSMFFTIVDPTDARFRIDRDYVRRGLARTEDDWYSTTGTELTLLWHTPYYTTNSDILEAGASMNYVYVGRDLDPLDWVSKTDAPRMPGSYLPAHGIIEKIIFEAKPGSIVPIRLGAVEGGRDDYLFRELALLVDALEGAGYSIVPVSTLIEHAE
jgi:peptidoglycan/xylan/chitin deacetylase (PgdA/CDA1 family)